MKKIVEMVGVAVIYAQGIEGTIANAKTHNDERKNIKRTIIYLLKYSFPSF